MYELIWKWQSFHNDKGQECMFWNVKIMESLYLRIPFTSLALVVLIFNYFCMCLYISLWVVHTISSPFIQILWCMMKTITWSLLVFLMFFHMHRLPPLKRRPLISFYHCLHHLTPAEPLLLVHANSLQWSHVER